MRDLRKKRMRGSSSGGLKHKIKRLKDDLTAARESIKASEDKVLVLKSMSRTYWERWRWELEKR